MCCWKEHGELPCGARCVEVRTRDPALSALAMTSFSFPQAVTDGSRGPQASPASQVSCLSTDGNDTGIQCGQTSSYPGIAAAAGATTALHHKVTGEQVSTCLP